MGKILDKNKTLAAIYGLFPRDMDDKWATYFDEETSKILVYFHWSAWLQCCIDVDFIYDHSSDGQNFGRVHMT